MYFNKKLNCFMDGKEENEIFFQTVDNEPEYDYITKKAIEVEIYGENSEFEENEYDVYVNDKEYDCIEFFTIEGLSKARYKAQKLAKKYNVPIRENI